MTTGSFLICSWAGGGNTQPAIYLGQRLRLRGHRVRFLGWPSMAGVVEAAGLEFAAYPSLAPWPEGEPIEAHWDLMSEALFGAGTTDDICSAALADMPDVLVLDCMLHAGFVAAERLPAATVALVHVLYQPFVHDWGDAAMELGVAAELARADQVLAVVPAGLDDPGPLPPGTSYTGAVTAPMPAPLPAALAGLTEPGDPWLLLSMGTTLQRQRAALPVVLEALEALPVRALLALGGVLPANEVAVPANVTTVGFVQHERVLPYVDLVISHGGLSTISSALSFGKPLICIPQGREQPVNAAHLAACGAGLALPQDAGAEEIRSAVSTVLGSPTIRAAARAFTDPDAGERAADLVERLLEERARSGVRPLRRAEVPA